jgi:phosphodiesterase/alkaline phosphatase D-like protein
MLSMPRALGLLAAAAAALAAAPLANAQSDNAPWQLHVAFSGTVVGTGMTVSWVTNASTPTSVVQYGSAYNSLNFTATGSCSTYLLTWDHHVVITGLMPSTTYYYRVGDATNGFSRVSTFTTAAAPGQEFPARIIAFGACPCAGGLRGTVACPKTQQGGGVGWFRWSGVGLPRGGWWRPPC